MEKYKCIQEVDDYELGKVYFGLEVTESNLPINFLIHLPEKKREEKKKEFKNIVIVYLSVEKQTSRNFSTSVVKNFFEKV